MVPRFLSVLSLLLVLSACIADKAFDDTVQSTKDFAGLLKIAQNESDTAEAFINGQQTPFTAMVNSVDEKFKGVKEKYDPYVSAAGFTCIIYKLDYNRAVKKNEKLIAKQKNRNIPDELNKHYAKQRQQLEKNIQSTQDLQQQTTDDPKKQDKNVKKAQQMIMHAHTNFYDRVSKHMVRKIREVDGDMSNKRASLTRKGKRVMKCSL